MTSQSFPMTPAVLHILLSLADDDRHGYGIMKEVERRTGGEFKLGPGTTYRAIVRLLDAEMIEEAEDRGPSEDDDERRRYYRITAAGRELARQEVRRLMGVVQAARSKQLIGDHDTA